MQVTSELRTAITECAEKRNLVVKFVRRGKRTVGANFYDGNERVMTPADAKALRRVVGSDFKISAVNGELRLK